MREVHYMKVRCGGKHSRKGPNVLPHTNVAEKAFVDHFFKVALLCVSLCALS